MSVENEVLVEVQDGIMSIAFNRPEKKNALTNNMYDLFNQALEKAAIEPQIKVVLLSGKGDCFTAGNDIGDFLKGSGEIEDKAVSKTIVLLSTFPKPLVAAVHGNAVGIGTTMLLHCDLVVAADNSRFAMPFVPLGLCPEAGSSLTLPRLAGHPQAAEILFFGEAFGVEKAQQIGMLNRIVSVEDLKSAAMTFCTKLTALPTDALMTTKKLLKSSTTDLSARINEELIDFSRLLESDEAKNIFKAFLSK